MASQIENIFKLKKPAFIAYITAGYPTTEDTVPALLAMEKAGVDIIEVRIRTIQIYI